MGFEKDTLVIDPTVTRCPVCNKDLSDYTLAHRRKHIARCMRTKPLRIYSDNPRGRPSTRKHIKTPSKALCFSIFIISAFIVFELILHFP